MSQDSTLVSLTDASALDGSELLYIVQGLLDRKVDLNTIKSFFGVIDTEEVSTEPNVGATPFTWFKSETIPAGAVTNWLDSSGNGNDAIQSSAPAKGTGTAGSYITFTNVQRLVSPMNFAGKTACTMFVVARHTAGSFNSYRVMAEIGPAIGPDFLNAGEIGMASRFGKFWDSAYNGGTSNYTPVDDMTQWHVFAVRVSKTTNHLYVDGVMQTQDFYDPPESTHPDMIATGPLTIGSDDAGNHYPFAGDIRDVIVYDTALTDDQMRKIGLGLCRKYSLATKPVLMFIGDSIFIGYSNAEDHPVRLISALYAGTKTTRAIAHLGRTAGQAVAAFPSEMEPYLVSVNGVAPEVVILLGTNDLVLGSTGAFIYLDLARLTALCMNAGANVRVVTIPPLLGTVGAPGDVFEGLRQDVLVLMESGGVGFANGGLLRIGSDPIVGPRAASLNATYFAADLIHPLGPWCLILQNYTRGSITPINSDFKSGTFTLVGGTKTVPNVNITAKSVVIPTLKTVGGTRAGLPDIVPTVGVGFVATGGGSDSSTYNYAILEIL